MSPTDTKTGVRKPRASNEAAAPAPTSKRREATRNRLIEAARELFFADGYAPTSIDSIVRRAGLSRTAFYANYTSKDAILADIMVGEAARMDPMFSWFDNRYPSRENIRRFLKLYQRVAKRGRERSNLLYVSQSAEMQQLFEANRDRYLGLLGRSLMAFRHARRGEEVELRRRSEALLLIFQIEQFGRGVIADPKLAEAVVDRLGEEFEAFIQRYG